MNYLTLGLATFLTGGLTSIWHSPMFSEHSLVGQHGHFQQ